MMSNASVPGLTNLPASLSAAAIDGLLRTTLGFQGLVLTDSLSAAAVTQAGFDLPRAATAAIEAGADMVLFGSTLTAADTSLLTPASVARSTAEIIDAIVAANAAGSLSNARLNGAVEHVLAAKHVDLCTN
jgi:beta-N-acetylhexosaminidase